MKDKLHGHAHATPWTDKGLSSSPTDMPTITKDEDVLQSLKRANLIPEYWDETNLPLPTAPAVVIENPFDSFDSEPLTMPIRKKRTPTDLSGYKIQAKLFDAVTKPYSINTVTPTSVSSSFSPVDRRMSSYRITSQIPGSAVPGVVPVHTTTRLAPTMQAIFSTLATAPWKILNANDLACLEFGLGEADVKKGVSILEFFENGRRQWVEERLKGSTTNTMNDTISGHSSGDDDIVNIPDRPKDDGKERVVLCGEVVTMQKMKEGDGKKTSMAASLWVKEKVFPLMCIIDF
jgi:hypothetical protein